MLHLASLMESQLAQAGGGAYFRQLVLTASAAAAKPYQHSRLNSALKAGAELEMRVGDRGQVSYFPMQQQPVPEEGSSGSSSGSDGSSSEEEGEGEGGEGHVHRGSHCPDLASLLQLLPER